MTVAPPYVAPQAPPYWTYNVLSWNRSVQFASNPEFQAVFPNAAQVLDINGDGHLDVYFIYSFIPNRNLPGIPVRVLLGDGHGGFTDGTASLFGSTVPLGDAATGESVADFNGDGRLDIYMNMHGYDQAGSNGLQNRLILSTGTSGVADKTATNLPQVSDFSHWSTTGDIDGDGDMDIFVDNLGQVGPPDVSPYFLINDGTGQFSRSDTRLPQQIEVGLEQYTSTLLFDADSDGDNDLFLGEWGVAAWYAGNNAYSSLVLFNDGSGHFAKTAQSALPRSSIDPEKAQVLGVEAADINNDGFADLFLLTHNEQDQRIVQVLINRGDGTFYDDTAARLDASVTGVGFYFGRYIDLVDFNGDGALDLLLNNGGPSRFYLNDGYGHFVALPEDFLFTSGGALAFLPGDFNEDGRMDIFSPGIVNSWDDPAQVTEFNIVALWTSPVNGIHDGDAASNGLLGDQGVDTLNGFAGDDVIFAAAGNDTLNGGDGNDYLNGGAGADAMTGGTGNDTYVMDNASDAVTELSGEGTDTLNTTLASAALAAFANVENLTYLGTANFVGSGTGVANILKGGSGNDGLYGYEGDDTAYGGAGLDVLVMAAGADTADGGDGNDYLYMGDGDDSATGGAGIDVIALGLGADTASGGSEQDYIYGEDGNDVANGEAGNDVLILGLGDDIADGGDGDDAIYGEDGNDSATGGAGVDTFVMALGNDSADGGDGADYFYMGDGDDSATGGAGIDVFTMGIGADTVHGGEGDDYIYGEQGNDITYGDAGVDLFILGDGDDEAHGGAGQDYIYGEAGNDTAFGDDGADIFVLGEGNDTADGGNDNDYLYGGNGNDILRGGAGVDVILGEAGDDTFDPGLGVDYVFMGAGTDRLLVDKTLSGITNLYEFTPGAGSSDTINLSGTGWTSFAEVQAHLFDYTASGGFCILTLDADTAIWFIGITPAQLTAGDFTFSTSLPLSMGEPMMELSQTDPGAAGEADLSTGGRIEWAGMQELAMTDEVSQTLAGQTGAGLHPMPQGRMELMQLVDDSAFVFDAPQSSGQGFVREAIGDEALVVQALATGDLSAAFTPAGLLEALQPQDAFDFSHMFSRETASTGHARDTATDMILAHLSAMDAPEHATPAETALAGLGFTADDASITDPPHQFSPTDPDISTHLFALNELRALGPEGMINQG